jgi:hypothetical protein
MDFRSTLFRATDRIADLFGLLRGPFAADEFIESAIRRAGMVAFPAPEIHEPLRRFLAALDEEAGLSTIGRSAVHWDVLRLLGNVLRFHQEEARDPMILRQNVAQPVFVLGLPRSGTSFLHNLLATDPAVRAPRCWQMVYPWPIQGAATDRRVALADRQLRSFAFLAPEFPDLHPMRAQSTQECTEITAHCFRSLRFDTLYPVPSYRAWLDLTGHAEAYRFHRRYLQHLQVQMPSDAPAAQRGRWVLKCPDHVFALGAIRAEYPDAHLVFVHRDPLKVLASVARLTEVLRRPFIREVDNAAIGEQVADHWLRGVGAMMADPPDALRTTHIEYRALTADPVGTARMLYDRIGLDFTDAVAAGMRRHVKARPNGGYGVHRYRLEDHFPNLPALADQFRPYLAHFAITPETEAMRDGS